MLILDNSPHSVYNNSIICLYIVLNNWICVFKNFQWNKKSSIQNLSSLAMLQMVMHHNHYMLKDFLFFGIVSTLIKGFFLPCPKGRSWPTIPHYKWCNCQLFDLCKYKHIVSHVVWMCISRNWINICSQSCCVNVENLSLWLIYFIR